MSAISSENLYKSLVNLKLIDSQKLTGAAREANTKKIPLEKILISRDLISDENLSKIIADYLSLPFIKLNKIAIDPQILKIIPQIVAKKNLLIAFNKDANGLKIATNNPTNKEILDFISKKTGEKVILYYTSETDIDEAIKLYDSSLQTSFDDLLKSEVANATSTQAEAPVEKIVNLLIEYAYNNKASDIHIEPDMENTLVRFRIDGVLHDVLKITAKIHSRVITRIKVLSSLRVDEHMSAQDGKMQKQLEEELLDIRVSIVPTVDGEKAVLRLLSSRSRQFSLNDLGLRAQDLKKVEDNYKKPYGMILATGPTGSGKTTTIYAILKLINSREKNIATIEDPVEYEIEGVNQIQVNMQTNLTFAAGLKSILRQDPDIVFVGEIRDEDTAGIAVNSALTGHLVLSTIHTNNAATTLVRLIDMKVEPFLVSSTVNLIIAQRLVRKICEKCRLSKNITVDKLPGKIPKDIIKKYFKDKKEIRFYEGKGCQVCRNTGTQGRIGIFEVMEVTDTIKKLIVAKADSEAINQEAKKQGMITMFEDGLTKTQSGIISINELVSSTVQ